MWGELTNPKPLGSVLESISFLPDIFMLFHFPLFSVLLLGYRSPMLSAGSWLQCFARRGLCLCQPTITFPAEMAKSFFFSLCYSDIYFSLHSSFENMYSVLSRQTFWITTDAQFSQKLWQHNFSLKKLLLLMFVLFANPCPCWRQRVCMQALKPALYNNKFSFCCLNAN